jgi:hypothetical protein
MNITLITIWCQIVIQLVPYVHILGWYRVVFYLILKLTIFY